MNHQHISKEDPRIQAALEELKGLIKERFPDATFLVFQGLGDDLHGVYLEASADTDDTDEIVDTVIDRIVALQIDEGLPIHVLATQTSERLARYLASRQH